MQQCHLWLQKSTVYLDCPDRGGLGGILCTTHEGERHQAVYFALEQTYPSREEDVIVCFHSLRDIEAREGVDKVSFGDIAGAQRVSRSGSVSAPVLGASRLTGESQDFNNF